MDKETQNIIGRALYEISTDFTDSHTPHWEDLLVKTTWIMRAMAVIEAYEQVMKSRPEGQEIIL